MWSFEGSWRQWRSTLVERVAWLRGVRDRSAVGFWVWVVLACSLAVTPVVVGYRVWWSETVTAWGVDFKAYYLAGLRARAGVGLYDPGSFLDAVPSPAARRFLYPPVVALGFVPLTVVGPDAARLVWVGVQLLVLAVAVVGLCRRWRVRVSGLRAVFLGWCVLGFYPVMHLARVGNVVGFQVAALCVAASALAPASTAGDSERSPSTVGDEATGWRGAVVVAVSTVAAVVAKPFVALATGHLLERRRVVVAGVTSGVLLAVGVLAFGVDAHVSYVQTVLDGGFETTNAGAIGVHYEPFRALGDAAVWPRLAVLGVAAASVLAVSRDAWTAVDAGLPAVSRDATALALGAVAIPLVVPSTNTLELLFVLPAVVLTWVGERRAGDDRVAVLVVAAFALVHLSQWGARIVVFVGPATVPAVPWTAVGEVLYAIRPATVGLLAVLCVLVARTWRHVLEAPQPSHSS